MKAGCFIDAPPILCVIPYSIADYTQACQLLRWIKELGGCKRNACLLMVDCKVPSDQQQLALSLAQDAFKSAQSVATPESLPDERWPRGANYLFDLTAKLVESKCGVPFWWNEPDCIPLCPDWLEMLEYDYYRSGKSFMGFVLPKVKLNGKEIGPCVNGCAVYPPDTATRFKGIDFYGPEAWDILASPIMVEDVHHSKLIQHFWGEMGLAPTFRDVHSKGEPRNVFTLDQVSKQAVVFHRCKDGSLMELLRKNSRPRGATCFHSGDLGDIVYSLLFAKSLGDISLYLGPDTSIHLRSQMNPASFDWLSPLLRRQKWIHSVNYSNSIPSVEYNLNHFRNTWFGRTRRSSTLFAAYAEHFRRPPLKEDEPWLECDPEYNRQYPIVIARSARYRNNKFPWKMVSGYYAGRMQFVGFREEYEEWKREFGECAVYRPVKDALEMANVIGGAELFIGNQSFPMALAMALNVPVVQEVFEASPDCIFRRSNCQYVRSGAFTPPAIKGRQVRHVTRTPNSAGEIELGPCENADGLGDTLSVLPLASAMPRAVMCLPTWLEKFAFLFNGICKVRITDDCPVFPFDGSQLVSQTKLDLFGVKADPIPRIRTEYLNTSKAKNLLAGVNSPIVLVPTCSKHWAHIRQRPPEFWEPIVKQLAIRFTVLQFGRDDYDLIPGAQRIPWLDLPDLAACYFSIGRYVGCDTGDHHLMLAVGGRCVVAEPPPIHGFDPRCWQYKAPSRIRYASLDSPSSVITAIHEMNL